jgi:uncharacterized protein (DUF302 family)
MAIFNLFRNLLALLGLAAIIGGGIAYDKLNAFKGQLDPGAERVFKEVGGRYMENLDLGVSMVKSVPVQEGLSAEDVVEAMKSQAVSNNMFFAGEAPFYKQVEAVTGQPYRYVAFYYFCDAKVGSLMVDYNPAYTAFMPCRISLAEDQQGKLWLHMMDLEYFIYSGKPLPKELKEGAIRVNNALHKIMEGAAKGEF